MSVIDRYTGEERSPRSLSGGETFYTSLALALGLADVVKAEAGGVDLQTLFIDEGFGSLDEQTLDQVLGVIDELRDSGRAVGIVSHVADLKERVTERLEVARLPDGSCGAGGRVSAGRALAIVTGANHGIGAATALALARAGCAVVCTYLRVHDDVDPGDPGRLPGQPRWQAATLSWPRSWVRAESLSATEADLSDPGTPTDAL